MIRPLLAPFDNALNQVIPPPPPGYYPPLTPCRRVRTARLSTCRACRIEFTTERECTSTPFSN
jgi:hypothetical protein